MLRSAQLEVKTSVAVIRTDIHNFGLCLEPYLYTLVYTHLHYVCVGTVTGV